MREMHLVLTSRVLMKKVRKKTSMQPLRRWFTKKKGREER